MFRIQFCLYSRRNLKTRVSVEANTSKDISDPAFGTMYFITEWSVWFWHSRGCFLLLQNLFGPFFQLSSLVKWLLNPARHCRESMLIFSSGGLPWPGVLWLLPRGWWKSGCQLSLSDSHVQYPERRCTAQRSGMGLQSRRWKNLVIVEAA